MGKSAGKAPATPNPVDSINAQARANRVDTVSPYGSTRYVSNRNYGGGSSAGKNGGGLNGGFGVGAPIPSPTGTGNYGTPINLGDGRYTAGDVRLSPIERGGQILPSGAFADPYSAADYTQVTQLSPELQAVFGQAVGTSLNKDQTPFEQRLLPTERFNVGLTSPGSNGASIPRPEMGSFSKAPLDTSRFEDSLFQRQTRLLEPQLQQREGRLLQNLADRGLVEGSEAYTEAYGMEVDQANRLRQDAALSSVLAGQDVAERDRAFDFSRFTDERNFGQDAFQQDRFMGLQEDTLDNQAFNQDRELARSLNNDDFARRFDLDNADRSYFLQRNQLGVQQDQVKFQQLASLLGLSPAQSIEPIDVQGAINNSTDAAFGEYNAKVAKANAGNQTTAQTLAAIASIVAMAASDRRLKTNIQQVGQTNQGYNLYTWDWKDGSGSSKGVMADEVPHLAVMYPDGYYRVDYSGISW